MFLASFLGKTSCCRPGWARGEEVMVSLKGVRWTERRDKRASARFLSNAIHRLGVPEKITIEGSEATGAAPESRQP